MNTVICWKCGKKFNDWPVIDNGENEWFIINDPIDQCSECFTNWRAEENEKEEDLLELRL